MPNILLSEKSKNRLGYVLVCLIALHSLIDISPVETLFDFSDNINDSSLSGNADSRYQQFDIETLTAQDKESRKSTQFECQNNCCCHLFFSYSESIETVERIAQSPNFKRLEQIEIIHFSFFRPPIV